MMTKRMKVPAVYRKALQVLRARVRYKDASLRLPRKPFYGNDTKKIQKASKLYVETWIIPLIDKLEKGELALLKALYSNQSGDPKGSS